LQFLGGAALFVFALNEVGITAIPYLGALSFVAVIYEKQVAKSDQSSISQQDRIRWMLAVLKPMDDTLPYNPELIGQLSGKTYNHEDKQVKAELGISTYKLVDERVLPDLSKAEIEMTKLEERASIILGTIVFIPILFALLHIFRYVPLSIFIIEILIAIILGMTVFLTQEANYHLEGWTETYEFFDDHLDLLITNPRLALSIHPISSQYYRNQELGIQPRSMKSIPASSFIQAVMNLVIGLDAHTREIYLKSILTSIKELPTKERLLKERWNAYTTRVLLISISSTALGGLFASLAIFSIPQLQTPGLPLQSTPFLPWGEYILLMSLNLIVLTKWYEPKRVIRYFIILSGVYLGFYFFNGLLI